VTGVSRLTVVVDESRCLGSGHCLYNAPEVFDQSDDDGTVRLLDEHPSTALRDAVWHAAHVCPGQAIRVIEE